MSDTDYSGWALYQLQTQFENPDSSDDKRKEILKELQTRALEHTGTRCREGEGVFYAPWKEALITGHIYSRAGEREFGISGYCEYHFDEITKEPEEESITGRQPSEPQMQNMPGSPAEALREALERNKQVNAADWLGDAKEERRNRPDSEEY